jgi:polyferredoxin
MTPTPADQFDLDLLRVPLLRRVLRWPVFPVALQVVTLGALIALIVIGWDLGPGRPVKELMTLRKTNLALLMVWGFWWPGMIVASVLFGRVWCTVCPTELVNRIGDGLARRIGWPRLGMARWLRAGWLVTLAFVALQIAGAVLGLSRVPHYTAWMLVVLLLLGLVTGLVIREPHSFCKSFCPAGAMLSVYGRFTSAQIEVCDPQTCAGCATRDCVDPTMRHRFDQRSCPSVLLPFAR